MLYLHVHMFIKCVFPFSLSFAFFFFPPLISFSCKQTLDWCVHFVFSCLRLPSQSRMGFPIALCSGQMSIQPAANKNISGQSEAHHSPTAHSSRGFLLFSIPGKYVRNLTTIHQTLEKLACHDSKNKHYLSSITQRKYLCLLRSPST